MQEQLLKNAEFMIDPEFPVNVLRRDPQPEFPLHSHEFSELVIVYEGSGIHFTYNAECRITAGDVFVIHGNMAHGYRDLDNLKLINVIFDLKNLESPLSDLPLFPTFHILFTLEPELRGEHSSAGNLRLSPRQLEQIMELAGSMEREIKEHKTGCRIMITGLFMQMAAMLIRCYEKNPPAESGGKIVQIGEVLSFLNRNFIRKITVKDLVEVAKMSESSLNRAFRQINGMSPMAYCNRLRIHKAVVLLSDSSLNISEIAGRAGFEDSNYFSRMFRQFMGCSPREYRKNLKTVL